MFLFHYHLLEACEKLVPAEVPRELIDFSQCLSVVVADFLGGVLVWLCFLRLFKLGIILSALGAPCL